MSALPIRLAAGAAALVVVVTLSACSAGGAAAPAGDASHATSKTTTKAAPKAKTIDVTTLKMCDIFPQDAAEKLVASPLTPGDFVADSTQPSCTYNFDPTKDPTAQATFAVGPGALNTYNIDTNIGHEFTDVPGLGDEAHLERQTIFWRTGTLWAEIGMVRLVDDDHQFDQPLIDAAKAVQAQLDQAAK
jgi:hypothetical protein